MSSSTGLGNGSSCAPYCHFDYPVPLNYYDEYVNNPDNISHHSFKPFIHVQKVMIKFDHTSKKRVPKIRQIHLCSHFDRCIYHHYANLINNHYNEISKEMKISDVAIAYRNYSTQTNIQFAQKAFSYIKKYGNCVAFVGDFTDFFDNLEHNYLKKKLCELLKVDKLPDDYYQVFKSITEYSYVDKEKIDEIRSSIGFSSRKILLSMKQLRKHKGLIKCNNMPHGNPRGVPQGVSISAILSNVYMMDFDKSCKSLVGHYNGLYLRYCDDFILVFPNQKTTDVNNLYNRIVEIVNSIPNLCLQKKKTRIYFCQKGMVRSCEKEIGNEKNSKNAIDFLGFTYDGNKVSIRDKTISKYYYRMYKKIKSINRQRAQQTKGGGTRNLYLLYSAKGCNKKNGKRNFLSYIYRCIKVFGTNENVHRLLYVHYGKIKKRLISRKKGA